VLTTWAPSDGEPDTFYLARVAADGGLSFAGGVQLMLDTAQRERLRHLLAEREIATERRRRVRAVRAGVSLVFSAHSSAGGRLRATTSGVAARLP
jgi:hypothetical protein